MLASSGATTTSTASMDKGLYLTTFQNNKLLAMNGQEQNKIAINEVDFWLRYRAEVAKAMLPKVYDEAKRNTQNGGYSLRSAKDMAIDDTIEIAVTMAERLEARLKGGKA